MTDFHDDLEPDPRPKRRVMREHILQARGIMPWATKAALDEPFMFFSFDTAGKQTDAQRMFGATRGLTRGIPDTALFLPNRPPIWVELKWGNAKPDDDQLTVHARLRALGHTVHVANSVEALYNHWANSGVPMRPGALIAAQTYDGRVAAALARLDGRTVSKAKRAKRAKKAPPRFAAGKGMLKRATRAGIRF